MALEELWEDWGLEFAMMSLLVTSYLTINVWSLFYVIVVILGMTLPFNSRRIVWRFVVVPVMLLLTLIYLAEYLDIPRVVLEII